jgi:hypothetical protein
MRIDEDGEELLRRLLKSTNQGLILQMTFVRGKLKNEL